MKKNEIIKLLALGATTLYALVILFGISTKPVFAAAFADKHNHIIIEECLCDGDPDGFRFECGDSELQACNPIGKYWFPSCSHCYEEEEHICESPYHCGPPE